MNTHLLALKLMAAQGLLGAFDTLYHHELTEALPRRPSARTELRIHAVRALLYGVLFIGLAGWAWHGAWALVLLAIFGVEIALTLWDFVVEDRTRMLPATERVTHTVLAMNGGAFIALLALGAPDWFALPTALVWQPHGWLSVFLAACGLGVAMSGVRDAAAARSMPDGAAPALRFGGAQHVLVTGGTGFIGALLVRALLADGKTVTVLTRDPRHASALFDGRVACVARMADLPADTRIDAIVNLAGARILGWRWTEKRKAALRRSRIGTTQGVVDWIATAAHKPRLLISASAIGYYGVQKQGSQLELTERHAPQAIFMSQLCQEWEACARGAEAYGVQVACTRFGLVLGKGGALPMMVLPARFGFGGPVGSGRQWLTWIHVDDLLAALAHVMRSEAPAQAYNFTAPEAVPQQQFSATVARVLHRPNLLRMPAWVMRLMLGEQADLLVEGQRVVPEQLLAEGFDFKYPRLEPALRALL